MIALCNSAAESTQSWWPSPSLRSYFLYGQSENVNCFAVMTEALMGSQSASYVPSLEDEHTEKIQTPFSSGRIHPRPQAVLAGHAEKCPFHLVRICFYNGISLQEKEFTMIFVNVFWEENRYIHLSTFFFPRVLLQSSFLGSVCRGRQ